MVSVRSAFLAALCGTLVACGSGDAGTVSARLRVTWTIDGATPGTACTAADAEALLVYVRPGVGGVVNASGPGAACGDGEAIFKVTLQPDDREVQVELRGCALDEDCAARAIATGTRSVLPEGGSDPIVSVAIALTLAELTADAGPDDASIALIDADVLPPDAASNYYRVDCECFGGNVSYCDFVDCLGGSAPAGACVGPCSGLGGEFGSFCSLPDFTCDQQQ